MSYNYDRRKIAKLSPLQLHREVEALVRDSRTFVYGGYTRRGQRVLPVNGTSPPDALLEGRFAANDQRSRAEKLLPELPSEEVRRRFNLAIYDLRNVVRESEPLLHEQPADGTEMGDWFSSAAVHFRVALRELEAALWPASSR